MFTSNGVSLTIFILASNFPPFLTKGKEQSVMMVMMAIKPKPVGLAQPPTRPKTPGLAVNSHSPAFQGAEPSSQICRKVAPFWKIALS